MQPTNKSQEGFFYRYWFAGRQNAAQKQPKTKQRNFVKEQHYFATAKNPSASQ